MSWMDRIVETIVRLGESPNQLVTRKHTRDVQTTMKWEEMEEETNE